MFREVTFYDNYTRELASPWWLFLMIGINLILLAILILILPELLAYIVAGFLLIDGMVFLAVAWRLRQFARQYARWREQWWSP